MVAALSAPVQALVAEGERSLSGGDVDAALAAFEKALASAEGAERDVVVVGRGHVLMGAGRAEEAVAAFRDALSRADNPRQTQFLEAMITMAEEQAPPTAENVAAAAGLELEKGEGGCGAQESAACAPHALDDDASAAEAAIIAHVSAHGECQWEELLQALQADPATAETAADFSSVAQLEGVWRHHLRPKVMKKIKGDEELPCGHTCGTCPTRTSCQLHDIEDMA